MRTCLKDHQLHCSDLARPFQIGSVTVRNRAVLAPMSGVTDLAFRKLAWRFGAGLVVTEMVASRELAMNKGESWARLKNAGMTPHMVQLAGREAYWMAEAAKISADNGADIIDINMGCPAKKVTGGYSGSALMRDPDHALSMIEATVKAVSVPVTVKMRLGWDHDSLNAPLIAQRAQEAGVQLVTVHGRTRMQFYEGKADWDAIHAVRDVLSIPLIANGDVQTPEDATEILRRSGADAVMVGRGAQGRPWHIGWLAGHAAPAANEICAIVIEHYEAMLEFYGVEAGLRHARKQLGWYIERQDCDISAEDKAAIMMSRDPADVIRRLTSVFENGASIPARKEAA
ncbi:tRNA dihydrouridine synthase DusB [Agrobacterium sp. Ap1]|uniref:tRNA dihydrouridine synthase DusB n=1 Tax=Agrobacterium sp. Ap1 TaxID=2815337 RepID=UPI001A8D1048|nr:tRNA dihydrouridine synthase DusB [Agrobacterium sp. Ap1]MBO0141994.1 tRNA dihydrouridine synthase DusB [Agrobacterium sp. Ap1]